MSSGNCGASNVKRKLALVIAESKLLATLAVNMGRSVNWYEALIRPASMREKSSSAFTKRTSRRALRVAICSPSPLSESRFRASCNGPSSRVSGVRNSCETLLKKAVLAWSSSASASARRRSASCALA